MASFLPMTLREFATDNKIEIANFITAVETSPENESVLRVLDEAIAVNTGFVIGLTGPPGVGKSTLLGRLIKKFREKKLAVAVVAVDPSSDHSGGAILGDRTRFKVDADDNHLFVRSMATRNFEGGLAEISYPTLVFLRGLFDIVLIETVGVGQSETEIVENADFVLFCAQPASGDSLQFMKAGIMEEPDLIFVTKGDLGKAAVQTASDIQGALSLSQKNEAIGVAIVSSLSCEGILDGFKLLEECIIERQTLHSEEIRKKQHEKWIVKKLSRLYGLETIRVLNKSSWKAANNFSDANRQFTKLNNLMSNFYEALGEDF